MESVIETTFALAISGLCAWAFSTLYRTTKVVAILQQRLTDQEDRIDAHEAKFASSERRLNRLETARQGW